MFLRASASANCEFRFSICSEPLRLKKATDNEERKNKEYLGKLLDNIAAYTSMLAEFPDSEVIPVYDRGKVLNWPRSMVENYLNESLKTFDLLVKPSEKGMERVQKFLAAKGDNLPFVAAHAVDAGTREAGRDPKVAGSPLDITSKSQEAQEIDGFEEPDKKHKAWGRTQKPKKFTKLARHKILEAGGVFDMERKLKFYEQRELTLTIPGSDPRVFKVIADWSGWLINCMTQVIRDFTNMMVFNGFDPDY
jgi:hypothetical protein